MARSLAKNSIPTGWKYDLLDKFATRCSGHTPSKSFPEYWDGGIKWISLADSFRLDQGYVYETDKEISEAGIANSSAELHPAETVVLSRDAGIGKSGVMAEPMAVSQHFIAWKCDNSEKLNSWFLYNWLQLNKAEFERQAVGSTIKTIGLPYFKKLKIAVPPYPEQNKIAQILSTWDKAITTTEQLLTNSKQQKKALIQQLLTGKKRLLDKNGMRFDGEWKKIAIGKMIKEVKKVKEENPNSIELLTVKLHYKGVTRTGKFPNATERGRPYFKRFSGELIIGRQNLHNGGVAIVSDECNGLIASNAISSFEARKGVDLNYVLSIMSTDHFRFSINNLAGGTGQKEIGVNDLLSLSLVVPDFAEQQKIAAVLSSADQEIAALQQKLDALKKEKKALMQQLLTGKRLVKVN
jgi:type I restriction enzyme, S subunit